MEANERRNSFAKRTPRQERPLGRALSSNHIDPWRGRPFARELLDHAPPHDLALERNVLGSVMVGWSYTPDCTAWAMLAMDAFDFHGYSGLFVELRSAWRRRVRLTGYSLLEIARRSRLGAADIAEAIHEAHSPSTLKHRCSTLRALRLARERIFLAVELLQHSYGAAPISQKWIADAKRLLSSIEEDSNDPA